MYEEIDEEAEVFLLLQNAFNAQVVLSEKHRTLEEIQAMLAPYFNANYQSLFLQSNLVKEVEGYIIYGSDFAQYYIPYFTYNDNTKIVKNEAAQKMYVYEFIEGSDLGPVSFDDHYEIVVLTKDIDRWLISDYVASCEKPKELVLFESEQKVVEMENISTINKNLFVQSPPMYLQSPMSLIVERWKPFYTLLFQNTMLQI